jgi:hypothetical protein
MGEMDSLYKVRSTFRVEEIPRMEKYPLLLT